MPEFIPREGVSSRPVTQNGTCRRHEAHDLAALPILTEEEARQVEAEHYVEGEEVPEVE